LMWWILLMQTCLIAKVSMTLLAFELLLVSLNFQNIPIP
jgi:hypothetical protein